MNKNIQMYERELLEGLPIRTGGLNLYPLTVRGMRELNENKEALSVMKQRLPAQLARMPYLYLFAVLDAASETTKLTEQVRNLLSMSLKTEREKLKYMISPDEQKAWIETEQDGVKIKITEALFKQLRKIIAMQNAIELPDERGNLEILEDEAELESRRAAELEQDDITLQIAYAEISGKSLTEVRDMTIYEFWRHIEARDLIEKYRAIETAVYSGFVSYKGGSPVPSWRYPKKKFNTHGMEKLSKVTKKAGGLTNAPASK